MLQSVRPAPPLNYISFTHWLSGDRGGGRSANPRTLTGGLVHGLRRSIPTVGHISLGDIHNMPTFWVLALFGNFYNFCFDVQTCRHLGGGGYVYTF